MKIPTFLKKQTVTQAALIIAVITFISKFFGFFREVLVAKYFGATGQTDAFLVALIIPSMILGIFSGGFATLIIPFYLEKKAQSQEAARRFVNSVFMVWGTIFIILSILIFIFAPFCVRVIAYGFKGETFSLAVRLTRYLLVSGIFAALIGMLTGLLHAEKQFFFPIFVSFLGNIGLVISLFVLHRCLGINSWTIGQLFSSGFAFLSMLILLYWRFGFFHSLNYKQIEWPGIKDFALLLIPLVMSGGLSILNQVIDRTIASSLDEGSIASLNFATRIWQIPVTLLAVPIATAVFPTFSELALNGVLKKEYETKLNQTLSYVFYLVIPSIVFLLFFSEPIIRLFFERGMFDSKATNSTSLILRMYSIGLFGHAISPILAKVFYSFKETKTPLIISSVCIVLNIILNIFLSKLLGAAGIALATSAVMVINIILYSIYLRKYLIIFNNFLCIELIKTLISSLPMSIICFFAMDLLNNISTTSISGFLSLAIRISSFGLLSLVPFFILSHLLKINPYIFLNSYISSLINKLIKKNN